MPTSRQILEAMMLDSIQAGRSTGGGGGAADQAESERRNNYINSHIGKLLAGTPMFEQMYEQMTGGGAIPLKWGETPRPDQMERYMNKVMGQGSTPAGGQTAATPEGGSARSMSGTTLRDAHLGGPMQPAMPGQFIPGRGYMPSPLEVLLASSQQDFDERNAAVKKREDEIRASKDDLYKRTMDRVGNWGAAEEQKIKQEASDNINDIHATLADRGLANSTILPSYEADNARKRDQKLRELSQTVDDRTINYDIPLTQNKEDFVERIVDRGPSMQEIMAMAQQLGMSGGDFGGMAGGYGFPTQASNGASMSSMGRSRQMPSQQQDQPQVMMTPWGPVQQASYYPEGRQPIAANIFPGNPLNPMSTIGAVDAMTQSLVPQRPGPITSNAYPTVYDKKPKVEPTPTNGPHQLVPRQSASGYPLDLASILAGAGVGNMGRQLPLQVPFAPGSMGGVSPVRQPNPYIPGGGLAGLLQTAMGKRSRLPQSPRTKFGPDMLRQR